MQILKEAGARANRLARLLPEGFQAVWNAKANKFMARYFFPCQKLWTRL